MALLSLIARLVLDKTGFDQGIKSAQGQVDKFASNVKNTLAGAFSAAAIGAFLKGVIDATSRIKELSDQYGLTMKEVQETDFALKQSGLQFEVLGTAITKWGKARRDAVEGNKELRDTFARYGLTLEDLNNPQQKNFHQMQRAFKAMSQMNITAREQVEATDILGEKAERLANIMNGLANVKPPALFRDEDIKNIDKAVKYLDALKLRAQAEAAGPLGGAARTALGAFDKEPGNFLQSLLANLPLPKSFMALNFGKLFKKQAEEDLGAPVANEIADIIKKGIVAPLFGNPQKKDAGQLFTIDKNVKEAKTPAEKALESFGFGVPSADSLGRIGAFSGGGQTEVTRQVREMTNTLKDIRVVLSDRGVKLREI